MLTAPKSAGGALRWRADLALAAVSLVWGSTFILVKEALPDVSPLLFVAFRFALAAGALMLLFRNRHSPSHVSRAEELRGGFFVGLCLFGGYATQTIGLKYTSATKAGFLTCLYIVLVPVLSAVLFRKVPRTSEVLGIGAAAAGMALMTLPPGRFTIGPGDLLILACALLYAVHLVVLGHYSQSIGFTRLSLYQIATVAVLAGATCWWVETPRIRWTLPVLAALGITSLLATALAFSVQTWAQQHTTPSRAALIFSLESVFAWLTAYALAGEVLSPRAMLGAACILGGILLVELKPIGNRPHPSP
jgi:drug/metabolite transporter (DMT)-like permease